MKTIINTTCKYGFSVRYRNRRKIDFFSPCEYTDDEYAEIVQVGDQVYLDEYAKKLDSPHTRTILDPWGTEIAMGLKDLTWFRLIDEMETQPKP